MTGARETTITGGPPADEERPRQQGGMEAGDAAGENGGGTEHDGLVGQGDAAQDSRRRRKKVLCGAAGCFAVLALAGAVLGTAGMSEKPAEGSRPRNVQEVIAQGGARIGEEVREAEASVAGVFGGRGGGDGVAPAAAEPGPGAASSSATTTHTTTTLLGKPFVTFVTAETRGDPLLKDVLNFSSKFTKNVVNIGLGHKWKDYKTKVGLLADWLRERAKEEAKRDVSLRGPEIVAFIDGSDVFWGGCEPEFFLKSYQDIVLDSGAPIVFSAEVVCGEQDCNAVPIIPDWANRIGGRNLNFGYWKKYAVGCKGTWSDKCAKKRDCGFWAPCSEPPAVKFLNSGFIMGPVRELSEMVDWTIRNYDNTSVWGDQSSFAVYWLNNQDKVTLDYTGNLALSLSDMSYTLMQVDKDRNAVINTAFKHVQCLIHGNGRGIFFMKHVLKLLTGKTLKELRGF